MCLRPGRKKRINSIDLRCFLGLKWPAGFNRNQLQEEAYMAVKVLIKRRVPEDKARAMIPLFREMRIQANNQPGYITGETLRNLDHPEEFLVISTWESSDDWKHWLKSKEREEVQNKIDALLGGQTVYEIFHYGFTE
jgi:heme-degrading monooxygenase HmoA